MMPESVQTWWLVIAAGMLCGWWLAVRNGATYRGVGSSVSLLILLTAVLLGALALTTSSPTRAPIPGTYVPERASIPICLR